MVEDLGSTKLNFFRCQKIHISKRYFARVNAGACEDMVDEKWFIHDISPHWENESSLDKRLLLQLMPNNAILCYISI